MHRLKAGLTSGQASIKQTLNMFLTELDGFSPSEDVIVMAFVSSSPSSPVSLAY